MGTARRTPVDALDSPMTEIYDPCSRGHGARALTDLRRGIGDWRLWSMLGWHDIRQRYRRSVLGPFWLTLSMAILVASLTAIYGSLLKQDVRSYLPFISVGLAIWGFLAAVLTDGCHTFLAMENLVKNIRIPLSTHALRVLWRNVIILGHNLVIYVVVALAFALWPGPVGLLAIPGFLLLLINSLWMTLFLGTICVRFRDVPPIVTSLVQLLFFVSPVMWRAELIVGDRRWLVEINPMFHLIEVIREPLLGAAPPLSSWLGVVVFAVLGWTATFLLYARFRNRIAYWL